MMKKIISLLAILTLSLSLFGCQYFQPPAETPDAMDKEAAMEGGEAEQEVSVTVTEGEEGTAEQEASVTITEGDDDDDEGEVEQEASVTIDEGDDDAGEAEQEASVTIAE
jgi:predicted small lipoprotein YifL